jgi:hypothetical protein
MNCLILFLTLVIFFKWFQREGLYDLNKFKFNQTMPDVSQLNDTGISTDFLINTYDKRDVHIMDAQIDDLSNSLAYII